MIKVTFLGDIMCDYNMTQNMDVYYDPSTKKYNFDSIFYNISKMLKQSDYVMGNLETPISRENRDLTKMKWEFNTPYEFAEAVKKCGVDYVSTANNHCLDRGIQGLQSTIRSLNEIGLAHCGINNPDDRHYSIARVGHTRIGILSYTYGTNAFSNGCYLVGRDKIRVNLLQEQEGAIKRLWICLFRGRFIRVYNKLERMFFPENIGKPVYEKRTLDIFRKRIIKKDIRLMKRSGVDFIIVYLHIGGQYNNKPSNYTVNETLWFQKMGCDAVIANHEHVVHGVRYNDKGLVTYALGNCIGSTGISHEPFDRRCDYSIAVHIYIDEKNYTIDKTTYSVLKTIQSEKGKLEVWPVYDLIKQRPYGIDIDRAKEDLFRVVFDFSCEKVHSIKEEYTLKK